MRLLKLLVLVSSLAVAAPPAAPAPAPAPTPPAEASADEEAEALPPGMTEGPAKVSLGSNAEIQVPAGVVHGNATVTKQMLEKGGNLTSNREVGVLLWNKAQVIFEFDPVGYVKDDDKDKLDADKMLESMREGQREANKELKRLGRKELEITRWAVKPHYDEATHNMEWAPVVRNMQSGRETVNYNVRLLGRRGVMEATLLVNPDELDAELPHFREYLKGFAYTQGEDYAAWKSGDKVAEYGLAALVTGGAVAVAAKSGLLGKLWKVLALGLAGVAGWLKNLFSKKDAGMVSEDKSREE